MPKVVSPKSCSEFNIIDNKHISSLPLNALAEEKVTKCQKQNPYFSLAKGCLFKANTFEFNKIISMISLELNTIGTIYSCQAQILCPGKFVE